MKKKAFLFLLSLSLVTLLCGCAGHGETSDIPGRDAESDSKNTMASTGETEKVTDVIYNDSFTEVLFENLSTLHDRADRPKLFAPNNDYSSLVFYDDMEERPEEKFEKLPVGEIILGEDEFLSIAADRSSEYGKTFGVTLRDESLPFQKALHVRVDKRPEVPYYFQIVMHGDKSMATRAENGVPILISFWMRAVNCENASFGVVLEEDGSKGTYNKLLSEVVECDREWRRYFIPVIYNSKYPNFNIRLGYDVGEFEIGDFTVFAFEKGSVELRDMPYSVTLSYLNRDAAWRSEAFERIENIRKGDISVLVVDKAGNPIENAKVDIEMFEHEFEWGCGLSYNSTKNADFMKTFAKYFNAAVLENDLKWNLYERNPNHPIEAIETLQQLGIEKMRGHCLYWDRKQKGNDTSIPDRLTELYGDKDAMMECINSHITEVMQAMGERVMEWDVLNEACTNTVVQDMYGRELMVDWFKTARDSGVNAKLYYNDYIMNETLFALLDEMEAMGVDYDGIGIQSHYSATADMNEIYDFYCRLADYGKRLKITEYTFATANEQLQASFTRDLMILAFSTEAMDGFYHWGMKGGENEQYVSFSIDGKPRLALAQMTDLIYSKWWTKDGGRTNANGGADFRGFYGAYYVSVIANGTKKTVAVDCFRGQDNTITVVMP